MDELNRDGFALISGVFSEQQVAQLRSSLGQLFATPAHFSGDFDEKGRVGTVRLDICARYPDLRWLLLHPPLLNALRTSLGDDFVFLPEMSAHRNGYGSWHKDTTSQERAGLNFQWEPDYLMVEAAIYLQPNAPAFGGGLDVLPGSHEHPDRYRNAIDRNVFDKARTKLKKWGVFPTPRGYSIPSKPGDLVLFDFRIDHMATPKASRAKPTQDKLAIFLACSRRNRHATSYVQYISQRPDYTYLRNHQYPAELLSLAGNAGVTLLGTS